MEGLDFFFKVADKMWSLWFFDGRRQNRGYRSLPSLVGVRIGNGAMPVAIGVFMIFIYLQSNSDNMNDDPREEFVVRARGLPWSATAESVAEFFSGKSDKIF